MEDRILVLVQEVVYEVGSKDWYKSQIEEMVSGTAEFSSNYSDFHPSCSSAQMFMDILENVFDLTISESEAEVFLEII